MQLSRAFVRFAESITTLLDEFISDLKQPRYAEIIHDSMIFRTIYILISELITVCLVRVTLEI